MSILLGFRCSVDDPISPFSVMRRRSLNVLVSYIIGLFVHTPAYVYLSPFRFDQVINMQLLFDGCDIRAVQFCAKAARAK